MPSEDATSYFHQASAITLQNLVILDLSAPCKCNIEAASAYVNISRAHNWHQIYLLHKL
jgi:hypothetical protein